MEPLLPLSAKQFTGQLATLRHGTCACRKTLSLAKVQHAHFRAKVSENAVQQIASVGERLQAIFQDALRVQDTKVVARSLPHMVQLYIDLHTSHRIASLLHSIESESDDELYSRLDEAVQTVVAMVDPIKSREEKLQSIKSLADENNLNLADSSPRRMGILLLELMKYAFIALGDTSESTNRLLETLDRRIGDRRQFFGNSTPRYESSLNRQAVSVVHEDEKEELLRKAIACKKPINFWSQFSLSTRFVSCFRRLSDCERHGDSIQRALGASIGGLVEKINKEFQKVVQGKITPGQKDEFSHKLDIYTAVYKSLKEELKTMRRVLFTLTPDSALLPLLRYTSELRLALSEACVRIDTLKTVSRSSCLQIFQAVKLVAKERSHSQAKELVQTALQDNALPHDMRRITDLITHVTNR